MKHAVGIAVKCGLLGALTASCTPSGQQAQTQAPPPQIQSDCGSAAPASPVDTRTVLVRNGNDIYTYHYRVVGGRAIYEGDIVIGDAAQLARQAAGGAISANTAGEAKALIARNVMSGNGKWTNAIVPYQIEANTPNVADVRRAIARWTQTTGLQFVERTPQNAASFRDFISFQRGVDANACYSQGLGMLGGQQYIQLVDGCSYPQILHEIGHAIGLQHEQNRADRSQFVDILFQNIMPAYTYAFIQHPESEMDFGKYDFASIMHYPPNAFSCNGRPTVVTKEGAPVSQTSDLSEGDIAAVKKIFNLP